MEKIKYADRSGRRGDNVTKTSWDQLMLLLAPVTDQKGRELLIQLNRAYLISKPQNGKTPEAIATQLKKRSQELERQGKTQIALLILNLISQV